MAIPSVSVICSVFNGERFLRESIESVLNQSFGDFELLITNDGSSDGSADLIEQLATEDSRILVHHQPNQGLTKTLNDSLRRARGRYFARQDCDDVSLPGRFAAQVAWLDAHPGCAAVGTRYRRIDAEGADIGFSRVPLSDLAIRFALLTHNVIAHSSVMARCDAVRSVGGYDERLRTAQDYDLWCRLALGWKLANLREPGLSRRVHGDSIGASMTQAQIANRNLIRACYHERLLALPARDLTGMALRLAARALKISRFNQ